MPAAAANYQDLGEVTNLASPVINNGVIVSLDNASRWKVTGSSYLSKLVIGQDAAVTAPAGHTVSMTVDGTPTTIVPGDTYTDAIKLTVN